MVILERYDMAKIALTIVTMNHAAGPLISGNDRKNSVFKSQRKFGKDSAFLMELSKLFHGHVATNGNARSSTGDRRFAETSSSASSTDRRRQWALSSDLCRSLEPFGMVRRCSAMNTIINQTTPRELNSHRNYQRVKLTNQCGNVF